MHKTKRASHKRRSLKRKKRGGIKRTLDDGSVVEGDFRNGKVNGVGTRTFKNGSVYKGTFDRRFIPHGMGELTNPDGSALTGEFREGSISYGVLTHPNGDIYEGQFGKVVNGMGIAHGRGTYRSSNDYVFEGEFKDGMVNGPGRLTSSDGTFEEGQFRAIKGEIVNLDMPPLELSSPPWDPKLVKRYEVERKIAEMPSM